VFLKSLSGHIPRSWLRSSDLLPFYHQYPAACCGDFLLLLKKFATDPGAVVYVDTASYGQSDLCAFFRSDFPGKSSGC
jgi:hypothetical protein